MCKLVKWSGEKRSHWDKVVIFKKNVWRKDGNRKGGGGKSKALKLKYVFGLVMVNFRNEIRTLILNMVDILS